MLIINLSRIVSIRFVRTSITVHPEVSSQRKALRVAVIGPPNVGKSALTNEIIKADLCAVSKRMDTTRNNTVAAITENSCQLVVVDSPGLVGVKHARDVIGAHSEGVLTDPEKAITQAEHLLVVHDSTLPGKYLSHRILHILHRYSHLPASLVINKIDLIHRQSDLLELAKVLTNGTVGGQQIQTQPVKLGKLGVVKPKEEIKLHLNMNEKDDEWKLQYNRLISKPTHKVGWQESKKLFRNDIGWPNFDRIFFVSALTGKGIDDVRAHLMSLSLPLQGDYPFNEDSMTRKKPRQICAEHIRSEILNHLPGDIAYHLRVNVLEWDISEQEGSDNATIRVVADVICDKLRWAQQVVKVLPLIERDVRQHLQNLFGNYIEISIRPKYGKDVIGPAQE